MLSSMGFLTSKMGSSPPFETEIAANSPLPIQPVVLILASRPKVVTSFYG